MRAPALWLFSTALAVVAAIAIPYGSPLGATVGGVFVFWCGFGLVVVALIVAGVARWKV